MAEKVKRHPFRDQLEADRCFLDLEEHLRQTNDKALDAFHEVVYMQVGDLDFRHWHDDVPLADLRPLYAIYGKLVRAMWVRIIDKEKRNA